MSTPAASTPPPPTKKQLQTQLAELEVRASNIKEQMEVITKKQEWRHGPDGTEALERDYENDNYRGQLDTSKVDAKDQEKLQQLQMQSTEVDDKITKLKDQIKNYKDAPFTPPTADGTKKQAVTQQQMRHRHPHDQQD